MADKPSVHVWIILALIAGVVMILAGTYWYLRSNQESAGVPGLVGKAQLKRSQSITVLEDAKSDFDRSISLPGDPLGLATGPGEFVIGNRVDPWGFLRLNEVTEHDANIEKISVMEPVYHQKIAFWTVTWNGNNYVGYADGSYFQSPSKNIFTVHDPQTLQVLRHYPAPEQLGGLAWDGTSYWAATRRNTPDSAESAFLYQIDKDFNVINKWDPPDIGCQGLAWDCSYLWFVDVFSDKIYLLRVDTDPPTVVHTYSTRFDYLSGIAYDGQNIWIAEYGDKKLHRLNPVLLAAWTKEDFHAHNYAEAAADLEEKAPEVAQQPVPTEEKQAKTSDTYSSLDSPPYPVDDTTVIEISAETDNNTLYGSWRVYFGEEIFNGISQERSEGLISMPTFAKYRITVQSDAFLEPVVLEYDADPGENVRQNEVLASNLNPGTYRVEMFIHVQFVDKNGTNRILNKSVPSLEVQNP